MWELTDYSRDPGVETDVCVIRIREVRCCSNHVTSVLGNIETEQKQHSLSQAPVYLTSPDPTVHLSPGSNQSGTKRIVSRL